MPKLSDKEQVTVHIQQLSPAVGEVVEEIRQFVLAISPEIGERIKWNNPSFYYTGNMMPFDPKEYKREIAVFNLFKDRIMLVFPSGAKLNDTTGLLEGQFKDDRKTAIFKDMEDLNTKKLALQKVILNWLAGVEK
jgi:hypothetical protein